MQDDMKIRLTFGANPHPSVKEQDFTALPFRCPRCKAEVYPQNLMEVCCECGAEGTKQHFSAVERIAA